MRRYVAIGAAAVALTYFLDPENGRRRRRAVLAWLDEAARGTSERAPTPEEAPVETVVDRRPSAGEDRPTTDGPAREPVVVGVAAAPETEEVPSAVAVAERAAPGAMLPPPLPKDVLETPPSEPPLEEQPTVPAPRNRRGLLIGGVALLIAALAAAGLAAWSFDVFDESDDGQPSSSASALSGLAQRQARAISIMAQPGATRLPVVGAEESLLLVVGMEGDAVLIVSRLDRAPAGKTYEIWVISGKTPRPAGLFRGGRDTVVPLTRVVPKGATVALTLERVGGSLKPTSEPLFAVTRS
jgi:anti-sigma-K factor RskA